jgi:hypothetical protein
MSIATVTSDWLDTAHREFEAALPQIDGVARFKFRGLPQSQRREAVADVRAAAWHAWIGLVRRGQDPVAIGPTGIAANACRYVRNGRRLGCGSPGRGAMDVFHPAARRRLGFQIVSLNRLAPSHVARSAGDWRECLAHSNCVTPADEACFRVDFTTWLAGLPDRKRQMVDLLMIGHETSVVARMLAVTPAAVSLTRSWLARSWSEFQGEAAASA